MTITPFNNNPIHQARRVNTEGAGPSFSGASSTNPLFMSTPGWDSDSISGSAVPSSTSGSVSITTMPLENVSKDDVLISIENTQGFHDIKQSFSGLSDNAGYLNYGNESSKDITMSFGDGVSYRMPIGMLNYIADPTFKEKVADYLPDEDIVKKIADIDPEKMFFVLNSGDANHQGNQKEYIGYLGEENGKIVDYQGWSNDFSHQQEFKEVTQPIHSQTSERFVAVMQQVFDISGHVDVANDLEAVPLPQLSFPYGYPGAKFTEEDEEKIKEYEAELEDYKNSELSQSTFKGQPVRFLNIE